jgi:hypothetical protein
VDAWIATAVASSWELRLRLMPESVHRTGSLTTARRKGAQFGVSSVQCRAEFNVAPAAKRRQLS